MRFKCITNSPSQTKKLGEILAKKIIQSSAKKKHARVFGLMGDLGGGKTTFLQGFAKGLRIKEKILSPTFVILKKFNISQTAKQPNSQTVSRRKIKDKKIVRMRAESWKAFYHIDCYRIQKTQEILDLGFKKIIFNPKHIVAIEWADRIRKIMPKDTIWIYFDFINKKRRRIRSMVK